MGCQPRRRSDSRHPATVKSDWTLLPNLRAMARRLCADDWTAVLVLSLPLILLLTGHLRQRNPDAHKNNRGNYTLRF